VSLSASARSGRPPPASSTQGVAASFDPDWHHRAAKLAHTVLTDLRATLERRDRDGQEILRALIVKPITVTPTYWNGIFARRPYSPGLGGSALGKVTRRKGS